MNLQISVSQQTSPATGWWKVMTLIIVGIILILSLAMQLPTKGTASRQPSQNVVSRSHSGQLSPRVVPVPTPPATAPLAVPAEFSAANAQQRISVTPQPPVGQPRAQPVQTPPVPSSGDNATLTVTVSR